MKKPTWTSLTIQTLQIMDDFLSATQLCDLTGASHNQMSATLHHLQSRKVVDAVLVQGEPFWFLTGADERVTSIDEKIPELPGSRNRTRGHAKSSKAKNLFPRKPK
jgi:hypothetical protein